MSGPVLGRTSVVSTVESCRFDGETAFATRPGFARLKIELLAGKSVVTDVYASSPIKLLTPRNRGPSVWAYTSNLGGGFVAGDQTRLDLSVGSGATCFLTTQASTKVYRNPHQRPCGHAAEGQVGSGSLLIFAPDPVQMFAHSSFQQRQNWHLTDVSSGLVLVDSFSAGRAAHGDRWAFTRFHSRNDVFIDGERVFLDSVLLDQSEGKIDTIGINPCYACFAMVVLIGPQLRERARGILDESALTPVRKCAPLVSSASAIPHGAVLRIAGERTESVGHEIRRQLQPLAPLLGDDPWLRKW